MFSVLISGFLIRKDSVVVYITWHLSKEIKRIWTVLGFNRFIVNLSERPRSTSLSQNHADRVGMVKLATSIRVRARANGSTHCLMRSLIMRSVIRIHGLLFWAAISGAGTSPYGHCCDEGCCGSRTSRCAAPTGTVAGSAGEPPDAEDCGCCHGRIPRGYEESVAHRFGAKVVEFVSADAGPATTSYRSLCHSSDNEI